MAAPVADPDRSVIELDSATLGTSFPPFIEAIIGGAIVLPPGGYISLQALTTAITVVASILWSEEPV